MRSSRADRRIVAVVVGLSFLVAATWGLPRGLLAMVTRGALACLDDEVAGLASAPCDLAEDRLARLSQVPWVHHDATYRYEELRARRALLAYAEAAVGSPDPEARADAASRVAQHEEFVEEGSQRIRLEELGRPMAVPRVGQAALELGDRRTLLERYDHLGAWHVRLAVLRAALQEGDLAKAEVIAGRYAEFDPRDADLRAAVGAVLCLGDDPGRGLEVLARIPGDRAEKRYAAMARNYGEVRRVQEACADLAGIEAPPLPIDRDAGVPDAVEARAALTLRLAKGDAEKREAIDEAKRLLTGGAPPSGTGLSPRLPGARIALLAELLRADDAIDAEALAALAEPRSTDEPPLLPKHRLDATRALPPSAADVPLVAPEAFSAAAARVAALASPGAPPGEERRALRAPLRKRLDQLHAALRIEASVGFAQAGDAARARAEANEARDELTPEQGAWLRASLGALAGDPTIARAESAGRSDDVALALAEAFGAVAAGDVDGATAAVRRASASKQTLDVELAVERRLWELALGEPTRGETPGTSRMDSWAGFGEPGGRWRGDRPAVERALDPIAEALAAPLPSDRRRARRAFLARRGDAPSALVPWVLVLGRLAPAPGAPGAAETWLDAALAIDEARFSMREVAFARAIGARARRDEVAAQRWVEVRSALRRLYVDPRRAEIAHYLGL